MTDTQRIEDVPATEPHNMQPWPAAPNGLALLRKPFPPHQISKLPKPTAKQTEEVRQNFKAGIRCTICGGWHHPNVVHLDYVGHAALTDRLLDVDLEWRWDPVANPQALGLPMVEGAMWITLTVCGVSRYGFGHAGDKVGGDAVKEIIGDALRNAGMRFGMALDLWHKGQLHEDEPAGNGASAPKVITPMPEEVLEAAQMTRLAKVASSLTDLVNAEQDPEIDNEYAIFEIIEPITDNAEQLYLSNLLGAEGSRVRSRMKEIILKKRGEFKAQAATTRGQVAPGTKKVVFRDDAPKGESA